MVATTAASRMSVGVDLGTHPNTSVSVYAQWPEDGGDGRWVDYVFPTSGELEKRSVAINTTAPSYAIVYGNNATGQELELLALKSRLQILEQLVRDQAAEIKRLIELHPRLVSGIKREPTLGDLLDTQV